MGMACIKNCPRQIVCDNDFILPVIDKETSDMIIKLGKFNSI